MFKTIVVATDGSEHADKAIAVAADLASKYDAEITLLHVLLRRNAADTDLGRIMDLSTMPEDARKAYADYNATAHKAGLSGGEYGSVLPPIPPEILKTVGDAVIANAEKIARDHGASRICRVVSEGDPARSILSQARDCDADLIVMGTRGLSDLQGFFVGSVSHKVSHLAGCTCITVR